MHNRTLGSQASEVSAIGYGLTMAYGPTDDEAGVAALPRAHDLGVTFFDTAEMYGWGTGSNEILVGKAVRDFRDEVVVATKFGVDMSVPPEQIGRSLNSRPDNIRKVADNSLRYLGVDHIDVFYQHRVDPEVPIEEVAGTVKELIDAGWVKYFGLSEAGPDTIRRAYAVQPVSVLQTEYSLSNGTSSSSSRSWTNSASASSPTPLSAAGSSPAPPSPPAGMKAMTYATSTRAGSRATSRRTSKPSTGSPSSQRPRAPPSPSSPWPGS